MLPVDPDVVWVSTTGHVALPCSDSISATDEGQVARQDTSLRGLEILL